MSSTLSFSTATLAQEATRTIHATVSVTETVTPPYIYSDDAFGVLSTMNVSIFVIALLVTSILGFSRLIAVPLIASFAGSINNGLEFYAYSSTYSLKARCIALVFADIAWGAQDVVLTLYSFFLLEKILKGVQRRLFIAFFSFFFVSVLGLRMAILVFHNKAMTAPAGEGEGLYPMLNEITRGYFIALATLEVGSAVLLLHTFYAARARSGSVGVGGHRNRAFFTQLAHSSEVRVAFLATVGVTRAVCFGMTFDTLTKEGFDRAAYVMENAFSVVLLVDLLTAKVAKMQAKIDSTIGASAPTEGDLPEKSAEDSSSSRNRDSASATVKSATESALGREYEVYVGKGWSVEASVAGTRAEVIQTSSGSTEDA